MDEVLLRPIQEADLVDLCRYSTDPEAAGEFEWTGFTDPKAMRRRWEEDGWLGPNGRLAVVSADSLAGDVSYRDRSPAASTRTCGFEPTKALPGIASSPSSAVTMRSTS